MVPPTGGAERPVEQKDHSGAERPHMGVERPPPYIVVEQKDHSGAERPLFREQKDHFSIYIYMAASRPWPPSIK